MSNLRVWTPSASSVAVRTDSGDTELTAGPEGYWDGPDLPAGTDYEYVLDGTKVLPDPGSRWQPDGVHGRSRVYDQSAYAWQDAGWAGRDLSAAVIYELHVGTFTPGGTFDAAVERLEHLAHLGITHVEVLPVNGVNGVWNWGYDGVDWYTVHEPIGGPNAFKRFVDAAHGLGLAVILDVVYNHLGPSGNYLPEYGPVVKTGRNTWGDLINVENPGVRRFVIDNALMWLRDFHCDGLRLDAVHALVDSSPVHILAQLSSEVDALANELGRPLTLIAESDLNDPVMIRERPDGRGIYAQWDDDVHHALHALLTGERQGYYCDFGSLAVLEKVFTKAFEHDGTYSTFRKRDHGAPIDPARERGQQFVVCLQNHDQVGNRAVGDRLPELCSPARVRIGAVLLLTSPFTPMLWMGEEWAATTRWPFFTSHPEPELAKAVSQGRVAEFGDHGWDVSQMIDPQDPAAYHEAVLDWSEADGDEHAAVLDLYRSLIALRASEPDLRDGDLRRVSLDYDEQAQWVVVHRGAFRVAINLAGHEQDVPTDGRSVVLATGPAQPGDGVVTLGAETAAVLRV